jgi:hypothetical protein
MPETDPLLETKIAALKLIANPRVAELVLVHWPAPDGEIYYATVLAADLLASVPVTPIEYRLPGNVFLEVPHEAGIADDKVELDFWDGDDEMSRLFRVHGEGARVEVFYWFPEVELLCSEWWGHLRPPEQCDRERFKASAQFGFLSPLLPLPRRAFFTGCQAVFGGSLRTQAEIDEGDCPYSAHLGGEAGAGSFVSDDGGEWVQTLSPDLNWRDLAYDDSAWNPAVDQGPLATYPWTYYGNLPPFPSDTTASWIWYHDSRSAGDTSTCYFRRKFTATGTSALLVITADNAFTAYLNGVTIAAGGNWQDSYTALLELVDGDDYVLAIVVNNGEVSNNFAPSPGGLIADLRYGVTGIGRGNLDPDTDAPYTSCPRNSTAVCIARLEAPGATRAPSFLAFDTIIESHVVNETSGPNITVTSRGNENNLKRPLRVIAGRRHVSDLDLLTFTVEPDTKHPDKGSVKTLFAACEGPVKGISGFKINGNLIAPQHLNVRFGENRQPPTSFSPNISNYSGTGLCLGVAQGDFTQSTADDLRGEADIEGSRNVRIYSDAVNFKEDWSEDRAWWLMHVLRNKRWGYGLDITRLVIQDFIDLSRWFSETVSVKDSAGVASTGPRSRFNAELIERSVQQQVEDICRSGRIGLPFAHEGKIRVVPLRRASELFSITIFIDRAFWAVLARAPTSGEITDWTTSLEAARAIGAAELQADGFDHLSDLFTSGDYDDRDRTDAEYVSDLYQAFFIRAADEDGAAFWLDQVTSSSRATVLAAFGNSDEFAARMQDQDVPTFTDLSGGEFARNICVDADTQKSTLTWSEQSDADLPNRIMLTLDDENHQNQQRPLTFEDPDQQFKAGRAAGDFTRRAVEKQYSAFGVTDPGEAARLGNTLLNLGEFDEGGIENNLRANFVTWWAHAVTLRKYQVIRIISVDKFHERQDGRRFDYFRVRSIRRLPDLKIEISCQAYPQDYYEQLEVITTPPELPPTTIDENPDGDPGKIPWKIPFAELDHDNDRIRFTLALE